MLSLKYPAIALLGLCLVSCQKFVDIDPPRNQLSDATVFTTDATADAAVAGAYGQLMRQHLSLANAGLSVYPSLSADEIYNTSSYEDYDLLLHSAFPPTLVTVLNDLWQSGYQRIYHCNALLEGLERSATLTPSVRDQLRGEALLLRAYLYFHLVNLFGAVPLPLSSDYRQNALLPRSPTDAVYAQVEADLQSAVTLLPGQINARKTRPGKWAALALLARVYLYQGKWAPAAATATDVLTQGGFHLPAIDQVFLSGSPETIWQLAPVIPSINTSDAQFFVPFDPTQVPAFSLTDALWNSFPSSDQRAVQWIQTVSLNGTTYHYPSKYKVISSPTVTEQHIVLRLAELLLLRAEARAHLQELTGSLSDLNQVHVRAGLPALVLSDASALLAAIAAERRWELFTEGGHRWFDLRRTQQIDAVLAPLKGADWQSTDALYPIPQQDLQTNPFLDQNPGY